MEKTLVILEVSRKQDYIFSSRKLRENVRRSGLIGYVTSSAFFSRAAGELYSEGENLVYTGGGHTVLQFDGADRARDFTRRVTGAAMTEFRGLELFAKQLPYDAGRTPGENLKELSRRLEEKKALRRTAFHTTAVGVEALDPENFLPLRAEPEEAPRTPRQAAMPEPPEGYLFPWDTDQLCGADSFVAVVHIDGNGMGRRVEGIYAAAGDDWAGCCEKLRRFSGGIQSDFEAAFRQTVEELIRRGRSRGGTLPIRPVILAGDDVCFVTAGSLGLECARVFLQRLTAMRNREDGRPYAACAGVALVHRKFPFHLAYQLSEELCGSAKEFGARLDSQGRVSAVDWHIEFGQLRDSLAQIRRDYRTEDGGSLSLRPVAVVVPEDSPARPDLRTYRFFRRLCQAIRGEYGSTSRSKIKDLRTAFRQGELESRYFLREREVEDLLCRAADAAGQQLQEPPAGGGAEESAAFRTLEVDGRPRRCCLLFDAIEMIDHCDFLEEVEPCTGA